MNLILNNKYQYENKVKELGEDLIGIWLKYMLYPKSSNSVPRVMVKVRFYVVA